MTSAGHHFYANGDLLMVYHRPEQGRLLYERWGFRYGRKQLLHVWYEKRCEACGCPERLYHAAACSRTTTNGRMIS